MTRVIRDISGSTSQALSAAQVVVSLSAVIKEIVENSIDANATEILVQLSEIPTNTNNNNNNNNQQQQQQQQKSYFSITILDDGYGIDFKNEETVRNFVRHRSSSKRAHLDDRTQQQQQQQQTQNQKQNQNSSSSLLFNEASAEGGATARTLGFRGEALHSISQIARMSVSSKVKENLDPLHIDFSFASSSFTSSSNNNKEIHVQKDLAAFPDSRESGTKVVVHDLFHSLPVRRADFERSKKKHINETVQCLKLLALARPSLRIHCSYQPAIINNDGGGSSGTVVTAGKYQTLLSSSGSGNLQRALAECYTSRVCTSLRFFSTTTKDFEIKGFMSSPNSGRSMADMQFFFLDGRHVKVQVIQSLINDCFSGAHASASAVFPIIVLHITSRSKEDEDEEGQKEEKLGEDGGGKSSAGGGGATYDINLNPKKDKVLLGDEASLITGLRTALQKWLKEKLDQNTSTSSSALSTNNSSNNNSNNNRSVASAINSANDAAAAANALTKSSSFLSSSSSAKSAAGSQKISFQQFQFQQPTQSSQQQRVEVKKEKEEKKQKQQEESETDEDDDDDESLKNSSASTLAPADRKSSSSSSSSQNPNQQSQSTNERVVQQEKEEKNEQDENQDEEDSAENQEHKTEQKQKQKQRPATTPVSLLSFAGKQLTPIFDSSQVSDPFKEASEILASQQQKETNCSSSSVKVEKDSSSNEKEEKKKKKENNDEDDEKEGEEDDDDDDSGELKFTLERMGTDDMSSPELRRRQVKVFSKKLKMDSDFFSSSKKNGKNNNQQADENDDDEQDEIEQQKEEELLFPIFSDALAILQDATNSKSRRGRKKKESSSGEENKKKNNKNDTKKEKNEKEKKKSKSGQRRTRENVDGEEEEEEEKVEKEANQQSDYQNLIDDEEDEIENEKQKEKDQKEGEGEDENEDEEIQEEKEVLVEKQQQVIPASSSSWSKVSFESAEQNLGTLLSKQMFSQLRVIGQFNNGFILTVTPGGNIFIFDQHASDEKANYEKNIAVYNGTVLASEVSFTSYPQQPQQQQQQQQQKSQNNSQNQKQKQTSFGGGGGGASNKCQPLLKPEVLVLDESIVEAALENSQQLGRIGFKIEAVQDEPSCLRVKSVPVLPYDRVQPRDVADLCEQLSKYGAIVKPLTAFWHSAATLACRRSIMIGTALDVHTMERVISNLKNLEAPWSCPHGRPTVRHVGRIPVSATKSDSGGNHENQNQNQQNNNTTTKFDRSAPSVFSSLPLPSGKSFENLEKDVFFLRLENIKKEKEDESAAAAGGGASGQGIEQD